MDSKYILQPVTKSYCPICDLKVDLLCNNEQPTSKKPWFYICWCCHWIGEVGVGEVKREQS